MFLVATEKQSRPTSNTLLQTDKCCNKVGQVVKFNYVGYCHRGGGFQEMKERKPYQKNILKGRRNSNPGREHRGSNSKNFCAIASWGKKTSRSRGISTPTPSPLPPRLVRFHRELKKGSSEFSYRVFKIVLQVTTGEPLTTEFNPSGQSPSVLEATYLLNNGPKVQRESTVRYFEYVCMCIQTSLEYSTAIILLFIVVDCIRL